MNDNNTGINICLWYFPNENIQSHVRFSTLPTASTALRCTKGVEVRGCGSSILVDDSKSNEGVLSVTSPTIITLPHSLLLISLSLLITIISSLIQMTSSLILITLALQSTVFRTDFIFEANSFFFFAQMVERMYEQRSLKDEDAILSQMFHVFFFFSILKCSRQRVNRKYFRFQFSKWTDFCTIMTKYLYVTFLNYLYWEGWQLYGRKQNTWSSDLRSTQIQAPVLCYTRKES